MNGKIEMDYSGLRDAKIQLGNLNKNLMDSAYLLFYDETNNVRKFVIKEEKFNVAEPDIQFVLGGIVGEVKDDFPKLLEELELSKNLKEIKSNSVCGRKLGFMNTLDTRYIGILLKYLKKNDILIHYEAMNLLYYSLVDIIDSINGFDIRSTAVLKNALYWLFKNNLLEVQQLYVRYNYPNLSQCQIQPFMMELIKLTGKNMRQCRMEMKDSLSMLIGVLFSGLNQKNLPFIQNGKVGVLIEDFANMYAEQIYSYPKAQIIMDEEKQIIEILSKFRMTLNGVELTNYQFVDSRTNVNVQLSDCVVKLISRYIRFCDRYWDEVYTDLMNLNDRQRENLSLLNSILASSEKENVSFIHSVDAVGTIVNMTQCRNLVN